jgi:hypothetical protein
MPYLRGVQQALLARIRAARPPRADLLVTTVCFTVFAVALEKATRSPR